MSASLALQEGRSAEAVQHQVQARDIAERAGLKREATLFQLMLGGYLLQSGAAPQALTVFEETAQRAKAEQFTDLEVQSHMARGGALMLTKRPYDAAQAYRQGGTVGEPQPSKLLAIECYRTVGQILIGLGNENEAAAAWQRAVALAEGADPLERVASSAPIAAKDLAALYRRGGLNAQADALDEQVKRWEREVPKPPADDAPAEASA
jgi:tetratricopeptide (TPR) repeat protein